MGVIARAEQHFATACIAFQGIGNSVAPSELQVVFWLGDPRALPWADECCTVGAKRSVSGALGSRKDVPPLAGNAVKHFLRGDSPQSL